MAPFLSEGANWSWNLAKNDWDWNFFKMDVWELKLEIQLPSKSTKDFQPIISGEIQSNVAEKKYFFHFLTVLLPLYLLLK